MTATKDCKSARGANTVADVVGSLGLGLAQVRVALLALGVWFTDGLDICLVTVTTPTMAREFSLTHAERGLLTTAAMLGVACGCFGFFGDRFGRKLPILFSYCFTLVMNLVTITAMSFSTLLATRFGVGIAMGIGMSPSIAMMSETTPAKWRMVMAGVKGVIGLSGFLFGNVCVYLSDPALVELRWRALFLYCSAPCALLGVAAALFLPESPAFLWQSGSREAAQRVLESMRQLNGCSDVSIDLGEASSGDSEQQTSSDPPAALSMRSQLNLILSRNLLCCTISALVFNLAINVINYHHNYGEPQVFTSGEANMRLEPAVQLMVANCFGLLGFPITLAASMCLSRKHGIVLAFSVVSVLTLTFAFTVAATKQTWYTEALFQLSMCALRGVFSMSWNFVHQFSVEIYPVACSTTGGAAVIGIGRIGSCLAPLIFELASALSGVAVTGYYFMGCLALCVAFAAMLLVPSDLPEVFRRAEAEAQVAAQLEAKLALLMHSAKEGGAMKVQ